MPIQLNEENNGKLVKDDYADFVSAFERLVRQHRKLRVLFDMSGFHGWDVSAAWEDFKFGVERFADIKRTAMVGESGGSTAWQRSASRSQQRRYDTSSTPTPLRRGSGWPKHSGFGCERHE